MASFFHVACRCSAEIAGRESVFISCTAPPPPTIPPAALMLKDAAPAILKDRAGRKANEARVLSGCVVEVGPGKSGENGAMVSSGAAAASWSPSSPAAAGARSGRRADSGNPSISRLLPSESKPGDSGGAFVRPVGPKEANADSRRG